MSFVQPDEFIILFDYDNPGDWYVPLTLEEKIGFGKAGIRTIHHNLNWDEIEYEPGKFNWGRTHFRIIEARTARMKVLFSIGDRMPSFYPADWYCQSPKGRENWYIYQSYFSPWCREAQERADWFVREAIAKFAADDVLFIKSGAHSGEALLSFRPAYYGPHAEASWRAMTREQGRPELLPLGRRDLSPSTQKWLKDTLIEQAVRQQLILVNQPSREIWSNLHPCWIDDIMSGNDCIPALYDRYRRLAPNAFNGFMFAYFWVSDYLQQYGRSMAREYNQGLFIGSEYCEGLRANTDTAIAAPGIRGFITGPLGLDRGHNAERGRIQAWHYEAVRESLAKWRKARL